MKHLLLISFCLVSGVGFAQKKPLNHEVYDSWNSVVERQVANAGTHVAYLIKPQEGDATLYLHDIRKEKLVPRTWARGEQARLSEDSRYLIFKIKPQLDTTKALRRKKVKEDKLPKDSLGIYDIEKDSLIKIARVKSYQTPKKAAGWLAFLLEEEEATTPKKVQPPKDTLNPKEGEKKTPPKDDKNKKDDKSKKEEKPKNDIKKEAPKKDDKKIDAGDTLALRKLSALERLVQERDSLRKELDKVKNPPKAPAKAKPPKRETKDSGTRLILRNMATARQDTFKFVTEYLFDERGTRLAFATTGDDSTFKAGVYVLDLAAGTKPQWVLPKAGKHKNLTFDEAGQQLAWVSDTDTTKANEKALIRYWELYHWQAGQKEAALVVDKNLLPNNYLVNEFARLYFSKDGFKLFFGTMPKPLVKDTTLLPEEIVNVDVWTWHDAKLQTQQNVELKDEARRSYLAVAYPRQRRVFQLGSTDLERVITTPDANADYALGITTQPYDRVSPWEGYPAYCDVYVVSTRDGKRRKIREKLKASPAISPNGDYVYWYAPLDSAWIAYSLKADKLINLTRSIKTKFYNELHDTPDAPNGYGALGWLENDAQILLYDRYDIWAIAPENTAQARNLTQNGRSTNITYRYIRLDPEERFLKADQALLLHAFDNETKAEGYFLTDFKRSQAPQKLLLDNYHFSYPVKAKNANRYIFTREKFTDAPDLYHSDQNFTKLTRLSNSNPQQSKYLWGTCELVKWTSLNGEELSGLLYKPEGFDPAKKYPLVVYYYERDSDLLNYYTPPAPSASTVNESVFVSNGYLIFDPDIPYRRGEPGESAYDAIMSGVSHLLAQGFVDKDKMGLQGQSWGGYQTAYLITRTNLFACAMAGAPVANMTSAYGGIRYGTGISRIFQYEKGQSRIGANLWENPNAYIRNSPLFALDKVQTPLLIMHNDKDGAVPYTQGIELFMGLKRLNKRVWMLTYNDEDHNLVQRKNRKDLSVRMLQFFDYYLKFAPEPTWMKKGVPATEKGIKRRFETE